MRKVQPQLHVKALCPNWLRTRIQGERGINTVPEKRARMVSGRGACGVCHLTHRLSASPVLLVLPSSDSPGRLRGGPPGSGASTKEETLLPPSLKAQGATTSVWGLQGRRGEESPLTQRENLQASPDSEKQTLFPSVLPFPTTSLCVSGKT